METCHGAGKGSVFPPYLVPLIEATQQKFITCSRLKNTGLNNVVLSALFIFVKSIVQHCYTIFRHQILPFY